MRKGCIKVLNCYNSLNYSMNWHWLSWLILIWSFQFTNTRYCIKIISIPFFLITKIYWFIYRKHETKKGTKKKIICSVNTLRRAPANILMYVTPVLKNTHKIIHIFITFFPLRNSSCMFSDTFFKILLQPNANGRTSIYHRDNLIKSSTWLQIFCYCKLCCNITPTFNFAQTSIFFFWWITGSEISLTEEITETHWHRVL